MEYKIYRQDKKIVTGTDTVKITGERVPPGFILELTHVDIADLTTPDKLQELGYETIDGSERILTADKGGQNYSTYLRGRAFLEEGEKPFGRVTTPTDGDVVIFSCHGKLWPKG